MTTALNPDNQGTTLTVLVLAGLAFALQQTMVIPALPALQRDLRTTTSWVSWLFTGTLLVASVATPVLTKLGDQYGKKRLIMICIAILFVGSVGASVAPDIWTLIGCRMIQGTGAALFPLSIALVKDQFAERRVALAVGMLSSVFAVGGAFGLVISGVVIDHLSWHFLFVIACVPVGISLVLVHFLVVESPVRAHARPDVIGAALLSATLLSLLIGLTKGSEWGWGSWTTLTLIALAAALLYLWITVELRTPAPMVDVLMLARRTIFLTNLAALLGGMAMTIPVFLVPRLIGTPRGIVDLLPSAVHYGFGATSTKMGIYLLPGSIIGVVSGTLTGLVGRRLGLKWPLSLGFALGAIGMVWLATWHDSPWQVVVAMMLIGAGVPFTFASMAMLILSAVRPTETAIAGGMNTIMRTIGGILGAQVATAVLATDTIGGSGVPAESAYVISFGMGAVLAVIAAFLAALIKPQSTRNADQASGPIGDEGQSASRSHGALPLGPLPGHVNP